MKKNKTNPNYPFPYCISSMHLIMPKPNRCGQTFEFVFCLLWQLLIITISIITTIIIIMLPETYVGTFTCKCIQQ